MGWRFLSPAYRHHDEALSGETAEVLTGVSFADYVEGIASVVSVLDTTPVIIGHSLGGVIAQKLAARGLARAIVLLNGSLNFGALGETTLLPDFDTMSEFRLKMLDPAEQRRVLDRLGPESGPRHVRTTSRAIAQRHGSLATFHEAEGFGHYLTLEPNWRQIADLCARWLADTVTFFTRSRELNLRPPPGNRVQPAYGSYGLHVAARPGWSV